VRARLLLVPLFAVSFVSCGSDDGGDPADTASGGTDASGPPASGDGITIADFTFQPSELTVAAGSVAISNNDSATHTVTADDGAFDASVDGGATGSITVDAPGTYAYHCSIHSAMTGTLVVT
jgi:plastocyanin